MHLRNKLILPLAKPFALVETGETRVPSVQQKYVFKQRHAQNGMGEEI